MKPGRGGEGHEGEVVRDVLGRRSLTRAGKVSHDFLIP